MTIWANTIVHNEENFIWFSLMSVVDHVDKILVWDTGSDDKTIEIIKEVIKVKGKKVVLKEVGKVDDIQFTKMRQAMLEESKCDWILILDGDEVWWEDSIKGLKREIEKRRESLDAIVVPFYNLVGDIYHHQSEIAGEYRLLGKKGHLSIKAINNSIEGLHWSDPYGKEGLKDKNETLVQDREKSKLEFIDAPFLHFTHLKRSAKILKKYKYDLGIKFNKDFKYPEVFNKTFPKIINSPWIRRGRMYEFVGLINKPYQVLWRTIKR